MAEAKGKVAIVGSGLIGRSWAMLFTSGGYKVSIFDIKRQQIESALADIERQMKDLERSGKLRGSLSAEEQLKLISVSNDLMECVKGAIHVQECVPEILDLKKKVYIQLDDIVDEQTVLSSSSSAMPCSSYTENLKNRTNAIVSHPVNPPYYMPLVELIPSPWTSADVVSRTKQLMTDINQVPVLLKKEVVGFVQPRIQYVIIQECLNLWKEGVMSGEDIDLMMTEGLAYFYSFMGPLEKLHLSSEGGISETLDLFSKLYGEDPGTNPVKMNNNPELQELFEAMNRRIPLYSLNERRAWRDKNIAKLSSERRTLEEDGKQESS